MFQNEITKAIQGHGVWKVRLKAAIVAGALDTPAADILVDNLCEFGRWLYGPTITPEIKSSSYYERTRTLHAQFHRVAGQIAALVHEKNTREAEAMLNGEYAKISAELTRVMVEWQRNLESA